LQRIYSKLLLLTLFSTCIVAQEQIGVAAAVNKNTTDLTLEQERKLVEAGYQIIQNHTIETDEIGKAQMLLLDGTAFSVGPNSSVVLDRFIYNPETAEGSLEVTARGLLRIVGGKVTKKQPALIRTNSATVGIRGGIGIVQTDGSQLNATFLYGEEMTVTPNCVDLDTFGDQCSSDFITTITEPGFSVTVESADSEPSEPEPVTEESLEAVQDELEASEEEPAEEESSSDESSSEESSDESSNEESSEESSSEESSDESSSEESSDDSSSDDSSGSDESSSEESSSDESSADDSVASDSSSDDASSDSSSDEPTTEVAQETESDAEVTTEVADAGDGGTTEVEVDEGLLDSSGVSDVSSDVAPDELGTADAFEVETEVDLVDVDESSTEEVTEEVAQTTQETTAEVAPIFEVETAEVVESVDENTTEISLASFAVVNPGEQNYTVTVEGEGSEAFTYNEETNSLEIIEELDHESQEAVELTVTFTSENGDVQEVALALNVADVDEAVELAVEPVNTISETAISAELVANQVNVSETVPEGTVVATFSATDPEGNALTYSLSGAGSELMAVSETGEVTLTGNLDFEANSTLVMTLEVSDGTNTTTEEITINVINDDEPATIAPTLSATSFAENSAVGAAIASVNATDPEGSAVTYTLSGTGSDNFAIDTSGNITLASALDYETATSYELTVVVDDGTYASTEVITVSVADVNEAPTLSTAVAFNAFQENTATGTTIATSSVTDPEAGSITYSLSGTGSENFSVSADGTVTLASSLDYETATAYEITLTASDGDNTVSETLTINVGDINEAPTVTTTLAAESFAENVATGTTIATSSASDPEAGTITYSISGTGSENFAIDADGNVTVASSLDYETTTSYSLTITASDGTNSTQETLSISITDIIEFALALNSNSISINEDVSSGTQVATSSLTQEGTEAVTYTLSGTDSDKFSISSSGVITTAASLDYETTTSYSLTVTVTDGTNTDTESLTIAVNDIDLTVTNTLAASGQAENISTGTSILTASASGAEGTVSYSITDSDNKFAINSSTGEVTLANALDYETKTSHTFTVTATDGVTTVSEEFTLNVTDMTINTLAVTLANSGAALAESSSSGTSVGSSSISNPDSETITYTLSGTGSSNFSVDSSGNVTTNATLDFETAKSYALTLTATAGSTSVTDTFTVNVGNIEELNSAVLRYSAAYNSASRTGFSATATRGPSGSSLPAYYLEQVGTTASSVITAVDNVSNNSVPVEIAGGSALNWRYFFPIDTAGAGQYAFAPNSASVDAKYKSLIGTNVTTTVSNSEVITAGRFSGGNFWFMATDKSAASINFDSALARASGALIVNGNATNYNRSGWNSAISAAGLVGPTLSNNLPDDISGYSLIIDYRLQYGNKTSYTSEITDLATWLQTPANTLVLLAGEQCCNYDQMLAYGNLLLDAVGGGEVGSATRDGLTDTENFDISSSVVSSLFSTLSGDQFYCNGCGPKITQVSGSGVNLTPYLSFWSGSELGSGYNGNIFMSTDIEWQTSNASNAQNQQLLNALANLPNQTASSNTTSTYNLYEDQVTLAGRVYTDAMLTNFYNWHVSNSNKMVLAFAVIPIENFAASGTTNDYFYPNFIPSNLWSFGDLGLHYCAGIIANNQCTSYEENYEWSSWALDHNQNIWTTRFVGPLNSNLVPEGQSLWWQVFNSGGVGVGLWAQISFKDSYDGALGSTTRDDQESLLNVVISNVDYRKNDTTRYSAGDTGLGMDGYHYWSYQGATNVDNDGLGINYGTSAIECATSNDSGCFWADGGQPDVGYGTYNHPRGAMITTSDPYKSGDMTLSVNYNSNTDTFSAGTFNAAIIQQDIQLVAGATAPHRYLTQFRQRDTSYSGFFSGILEFDVSGSGNSQLASMRSSSTLATFAFDTTNDDVQVVAPMTISAAPSNNYTSNWTTVDTGSMTLKFGDATNDEAKSAYISSEVFAAEIQDDGAQIDGSSGGSNNLAGVMVSYNTLDKEDSDLFHTNGNDSMPNPADLYYSTWGFWAMSSVDISPNTGAQNASVHLGTWVGGETLAQNEIPTSGTASMSGAAVMNVAYRYNQTGTNYDVHKYTTTADVAASFTWGTSGYSGSLDFTNFDDKNAIVANAGFTSFTVAITGTDHTYTGNSTDTLTNGWLGGASVAGALYGISSKIESGGRINVNLYKSGDTATAGANDFYMAEGIYLMAD
jgi:hypothetical protein